MIIKVSFLLVASVAALKISQTKATKRNCTIKCSGSDGSHFEQEFKEMENSTANSNLVIQNEEEIKNEAPKYLLTGEIKDLELLVGGEKMHSSTKKEVLLKLVQSYKQRQENLERKLLELNGLREEQSAIAQMKNQLREKTEKVDFLKNTIDSWRSESEIIREKIREGLMSKKQLDIAKKMINEMQRKNDVMVNAKPVREHLLMLQQQVTEFGKYNSCSGGNAMGNMKLKDVQDMEVEVLELKRRNKELELEKREMGIKLAAAQARIKTEEEIGAQIKQVTGLRLVHEELLEQVGRLQSNRFDMVQEVVYQRWLYTLLKFEVQDHQKQSRKASIRDCSQNSSKELHGKTHASTTSDLELESVSSNATLEESDEIETTTFESSSSSQSSSSSMKMRKWSETKDYSNKIWPKGGNFLSNPGLNRRFSMSMVSSDVSESRNSGNTNSSIINPSQNVNCSSKSSESPTKPKEKRVSFSDSVKLSTYQDMPDTLKNLKDDQKTRSGKIVELTSSVVSSTNIDSIDKNGVAKNKEISRSDEVCSRNEPVSRKEDRIKIMQLLTILFFLLILLARFLIK